MNSKFGVEGRFDLGQGDKCTRVGGACEWVRSLLTSAPGGTPPQVFSLSEYARPVTRAHISGKHHYTSHHYFINISSLLKTHYDSISNCEVCLTVE